jgi:hypothetical protein
MPHCNSAAEEQAYLQMNRTLSDYYKLPSEALRCLASDNLTGNPGFFKFGSETTCYGRCRAGVSSDVAAAGQFDALKAVGLAGSNISLPFDFEEVVENLRRERYEKNLISRRERVVTREWIRKAYYLVRELLPVSIRRRLQRVYFSDWQTRSFPNWPVDFSVNSLYEELLRVSMQASGVRRVPFIWFWPHGASSCLIMTHDVETAAGRDFSSSLMDLDELHGLKASFQVIPEKRYEVPDEYVRQIRDRGFELNVHDLNHDGRLYQEREEFLRRAERINHYCRKFGARGFRAGAMYRMAEWYDAFEFSYDMSVPNVAHLEPTRGGCCTVMPYFIGNIVELPLTTVQDYSLFHILNDRSIDLWKTQIDQIRRHHGLISFNAHPDYLIDKSNRIVFESLLEYLQKMISASGIWAPLPGEVDRWWRARTEMKIVRRGNEWEIEGPQKERARLAYAVFDGESLTYETPRVTGSEGMGR